MADISLTPANVVAGTDAVKVAGTALETIAAGKIVYQDPTTLKFGLADANGAAATRTPIGIALNGASLNQPIMIQTAGLITIGGTLVAGVAYYLSDTPGGLCPVADVGSGEYPTVIGIAVSTTQLRIGIVSSGVAL